MKPILSIISRIPGGCRPGSRQAISLVVLDDGIIVVHTRAPIFGDNLLVSFAGSVPLGFLPNEPDCWQSLRTEVRRQQDEKCDGESDGPEQALAPVQVPDIRCVHAEDGGDGAHGQEDNRDNGEDVHQSLLVILCDVEGVDVLAIREPSQQR